MFNLIDEIETTSRAQIHERTHPFDAEIEETVLAAAALVLTRRLAGSPSDTECHDLLDRLECYRRSQQVRQAEAALEGCETVTWGGSETVIVIRADHGQVVAECLNAGEALSPSGSAVSMFEDEMSKVAGEWLYREVEGDQSGDEPPF